MSEKIIYRATSSEEVSRLEEEVSKLLKSYAIYGADSVEVSRGFENCIKVVPMHGQVKEICPCPGDDVPESRLERLTPEHGFVKLSLDGTFYEIHFNASKTA